MSKILLVGSDGHSNVGWATAEVLLTEGHAVTAPPYPDFDATAPIWHDFQPSDFDHMVLCNGFLEIGPIEQITHQAIHSMVHNNLTANLIMISDFVRGHETDHPNPKRFKRIVSIGSESAQQPNRLMAPYCAAKAGLNHAMRCLSREIHPRGYRVFCINPGKVVHTPMTEATTQGLMKSRGWDRETAEHYFDKRLYMHRWQEPDDIAELVSVLIKGRFDFLAGDAIWFSGGPLT